MKEKTNVRVLAEYLANHNLISLKYIKMFVKQKHNKSTGYFALKFTERALAGDFLYFQEFIKAIQDIKNSVNNNKE